MRSQPTRRWRLRAVATTSACALAFATGPAGSAQAGGVLKQASRSPRVAVVQKALGLKPDRVFGAATRVALEAFQTAHGLTADGVVGPTTWKLIKKVRAHQRHGAHGDVAPATLVKVDARGARVAALQKALGLKADGVFGAATKSALQALQRAHGLSPDGVVGAATWALVKRIRARQRGAGHAATAGGRSRAVHAKASRIDLRAARTRVAALQRALGVTVDRTLDPTTTLVLKRFQHANGLPASGVIDGRTWGLIRKIRAMQRHAIRLAAHARRRRERTVIARGARVAELQRALGVTADGVFGAASASAVRRYQQAHGLSADGVAGPTTWAALGFPTVQTIVGIGIGLGGAGPVPPADGAPLVVRRVIEAASRIATMPYRYGGGHGNWDDSGYDCSGSVSYALHGAGLLGTALASSGFEGWGDPGPGRWITIYANPAHAYMVVNGRRFDTSGRSQTGSRWQLTPANTSAYVVRHPPGL